MTPDRQRTAEARPAARDPAPPTRTPKLREEDLVALGQRPRRGPQPGPPEMLIPGDGRFLLNTTAMRLLSPSTPLVKIHLYLAEKGKDRFLVVRPAPKTATDAIKVFRTGRYYYSQGHWPANVMGRAAGTFRKIGIVERCRLEGIHDHKNNWLIFNLNRPKPFQDNEGPNPMGEAIRLWLKVTRRKRAVPMKDALEEIRAVWEKDGAKKDSSTARGRFPFDRPIQLGAYLRKYAKDFAPQGLRLGGSGTKPPLILE